MVCFVCQKQATMSRMKARSSQTPPFHECPITVPPPQEGTPKFVIGDLDHEFIKETMARQLRRFTPSGMEEYLQDMTFEEHGVVVDTMKQTKAAVSAYNILLVKTARNTKDETIYKKITTMQFAYQRLHTEFTNAINRMKSAGTRHFMPKQVPGDAMEENADDIQENADEIAGMGGGVQVLGIVVPGVVQEVQPPPPTNPHPDDVKVVHKRKYEPNFGDSMEEGTYKASLDELGMFEYLTKKFAHKADLEKEDKIRKLDAAVQEQKMASQEVEQKKVQVSAAEVAVVESQEKLEEAKRLLSVADSNLEKAKNSLEYQQLLM